MDTITNLNELKQLLLKEKFYVIKDGNCRGYLYAGVNPAHTNLIMAVDSSNYTTIVSFSDNLFTRKGTVLRSPYVSEEVGAIMTEQLKEKIQSINKIYITEKIHQ